MRFLSAHCLFAASLLVATLFAGQLPDVVAADAPKPSGGVLSMSGKQYKLTHVVAYRVRLSGDPGFAVIASDRPIDANEIKKALADNENQDYSLALGQTNVRVTFNEKGEVQSASMFAANTQSSTNSSKLLSGELKADGDRARGSVKQIDDKDSEYRRSFELSFDVGLLGTAAEQAQAAAPLAKLGVSGTFKGNGKPAKIAFVSAHRGEPFSDKPSLKLIFTERDHSKARDPENRALFGDFGSAIVVSCHENGAVFGCEVAHAAHPQKPFSSSGSISLSEFQLAGNQVQGKLMTDGEVDSFKQKWEVDLTFAAPFATPKPTTPKTAATKTTAKAAAKTTSAPADEPADKPKTSAVAALPAKQLAIPKDAVEPEFDAFLHRIKFKHKSNVAALSASLAKSLAAQGWATDGSDLVTPASAILRRNRGEAELTIFVKPDGAGSTVNMMTEGLAWEGETKDEADDE